VLLTQQIIIADPHLTSSPPPRTTVPFGVASERRRTARHNREVHMRIDAARSWFVVPGDRPERFGRPIADGAHAVILDLEDLVAPAQKDSARQAAVAWLTEQQAYVRIKPAALTTSAWTSGSTTAPVRTTRTCCTRDRGW